MDPNLFYDQEMNNESTSWSLTHDSGLQVRGIMVDEEFGFSISHTFGSGMQGPLAEGMNKIAGIFSQISQNAPIANTVAGGPLSDYIGGINVNTGNKLIDEALTGARDGASGFLDWMKAGYEKKRSFLGGSSFSDMSNGKFIAATDMIKTFQGSTVGVSTPQLKTLILHSDEVTVKSTIKNLVDVCLGELRELMQVMGFQEAPGDYAPDLLLLNKQASGSQIKGTWKLKYGKYQIGNLLVTDIKCNLSKYNAMDDNGNDTNDPLYAELELSIEPASFISKNDLLNTILK